MSTFSPEQTRVRAATEEGILLSSEGHSPLFCYDEEIVSHFHTQLEVANQHTIALEEKLRSISSECNLLRNRLYDNEMARCNESQSATALRRCLQIEQGKHYTQLQTYNTLQQKHSQLATIVKATYTFNEMLRQEVEHGQRIIESMATKIYTYEEAGGTLCPSSNVPAHLMDHVPFDAADRLSPIVYETNKAEISVLPPPDINVANVYDCNRAQSPTTGLEEQPERNLVEPKTSDRNMKKPTKPTKPRKAKTSRGLKGKGTS